MVCTGTRGSVKVKEVALYSDFKSKKNIPFMGVKGKKVGFKSEIAHVVL